MNTESRFSEVCDVDSLICNLENKAKNLKDTQGGKTNYVYHYTNIEAAIAILKTRVWHLNSPYNMNDGLELINSFKNSSIAVFFSSFMLDSTESIAMWSMYAQPWKNGVIIKIPVEKFKKWIKANCTVYTIDNNQVKDDITKCSSIKSHAVVYYIEGKQFDELVCGEQHNKMMKGLKNDNKMVGYIKDYAWHYENELRLRADVKSDERFKKVAVSVPNEILDSIEFVTGPRFEYDLKARICSEVDPEFDKSRVQPSLFTNQLKWIYCDSCHK